MSFPSFFRSRKVGSRRSQSKAPRGKNSCGRRVFPRLLLEALEVRALPSTATWINPGGGDWDTPGNWSTAVVPGTDDDVIINLAGINVTHSTSLTSTINSLNLSQATLTLIAPLLVNGSFSSSVGTITGS